MPVVATFATAGLAHLVGPGPVFAAILAGGGVLIAATLLMEARLLGPADEIRARRERQPLPLCVLLAFLGFAAVAGSVFAGLATPVPGAEEPAAIDFGGMLQLAVLDGMIAFLLGYRLTAARARTSSRPPGRPGPMPSPSAWPPRCLRAGPAAAPRAGDPGRRLLPLECLPRSPRRRAPVGRLDLGIPHRRPRRRHPLEPAGPLTRLPRPRLATSRTFDTLGGRWYNPSASLTTPGAVLRRHSIEGVHEPHPDDRQRGHQCGPPQAPADRAGHRRGDRRRLVGRRPHQRADPRARPGQRGGEPPGQGVLGAGRAGQRPRALPGRAGHRPHEPHRRTQHQPPAGAARGGRQEDRPRQAGQQGARRHLRGGDRQDRLRPPARPRHPTRAGPGQPGRRGGARAGRPAPRGDLQWRGHRRRSSPAWRPAC